MDVRCPGCNKLFRIADEKITGSGIRFTCTRCGEAVKVTREEFETYTLSQSAVSALDSFVPKPKPKPEEAKPQQQPQEPPQPPSPHPSEEEFTEESIPDFLHQQAPAALSGSEIFGEQEPEQSAPHQAPEQPAASDFDFSFGGEEQEQDTFGAAPAWPEPEQQPAEDAWGAAAPEPSPETPAAPAESLEEALPAFGGSEPPQETAPPVMPEPAAPEAAEASPVTMEEPEAGPPFGAEAAAETVQEEREEAVPAKKTKKQSRAGMLVLLLLSIILLLGAGAYAGYLYFPQYFTVLTRYFPAVSRYLPAAAPRQAAAPPQAPRTSPAARPWASASITTDGLRIIDAAGTRETNGDLVITGRVVNDTDMQRVAWYVVADVRDAQGKSLFKVRLVNGRQIYTREDYGLLAKRGIDVAKLKAASLQQMGVIIPAHESVSFSMRSLQPPAAMAGFTISLQPFDPLRLYHEIEAETR